MSGTWKKNVSILAQQSIHCLISEFTARPSSFVDQIGHSLRMARIDAIASGASRGPAGKRSRNA